VSECKREAGREPIQRPGWLWRSMGAPSQQPNGSGLPCGGFGIGPAPSDVNRCKAFLGRKMEGQSGKSDTGAAMARRDMPMEATCQNGEIVPARAHRGWRRATSSSAAPTYNTRIRESDTGCDRLQASRMAAYPRSATSMASLSGCTSDVERYHEPSNLSGSSR